MEATIMVPNESKLTYTINIFIVASCCILFSYGSHLNTNTNFKKCLFFGDVNDNVQGKRDILKGRVTVLYYKWPTFTVKNRL